MKTKKTFEDLRSFNSCVNMLAAQEENFLQTKLGYAAKKVSKQIQEIFNGYNEEMEDIRIEHALTDEKTGAVLYEDTKERPYKFNKEGLKKIMKETKKLNDRWSKREFEIEPYFVTELPKLDIDLEYLKGLVIK